MSKSISVNELGSSLQKGNISVVIDVRKTPAFESSPAMIPTAVWQAHDEVDKWSSNYSKDSQVVVYCVHGHAVSQGAAKALSELGFDAVYLEGGIAQWVEAGLEVS